MNKHVDLKWEKMKNKNRKKIEQSFFENLMSFNSNISENYADLKRIKKWIENWSEFFYKVKNSLIMKSTKIKNWTDCENLLKIENFR